MSVLYMGGLRMIEYKDSEFAQILPGALCSPEARAVSYAVNKVIKWLLSCAEGAKVYAAIDKLEDDELDLLALELNAQYYDNSLNVRVKRGIIKNAIKWHCSAGTPAAVQELIETVFEAGSVREWWEYDGKPYCFRVRAEVPLTESAIESFTRIIQNIKNTRSHLDAVEVFREVHQKLYSGAGAYWKVINQTIEDTFTDNFLIGQALRVASGTKSIGRFVIEEEER